MPQCAAYGCDNRLNKELQLSFHRLPVDPKRRLEWIEAAKVTSPFPTLHTRLCSTHFKSTDFIEDPKRKVLKPDAVPSIFNFPEEGTIVPPKIFKSRPRKLRPIGDITKRRISSTLPVGARDAFTSDQPSYYFIVNNSGDTNVVNNNEQLKPVLVGPIFPTILPDKPRQYKKKAKDPNENGANGGISDNQFITDESQKEPITSLHKPSLCAPNRRLTKKYLIPNECVEAVKMPDLTDPTKMKQIWEMATAKVKTQKLKLRSLHSKLNREKRNVRRLCELINQVRNAWTKDLTCDVPLGIRDFNMNDFIDAK